MGRPVLSSVGAALRRLIPRFSASAPSNAVGGTPIADPGVVAVARYDAAGNGRRMRGWNAPGTGPNRSLVGLETIRNRSRDAARNDWTAAAATRVWTTSLVGAGIVPRPRTADTALKQRLVSAWAAWVPFADADGVLDFYGLQALAVRSWISSGEVFIRFRRRRAEDGLATPLQIQLLEGDMVPRFDAESWPGMPEGHRIREGVEFSPFGMRVAYWVYHDHPGDGASSVPTAGQLHRVEADQLRHMFEPLRPGQIRGVSDFAPILAKLRGVADFDDAVLERQRLANLFALFITRPDPNLPTPLDPTSGAPVQYDSALDGSPEIRLEPGIAQELAPGEDVKFSAPPDAGATYGEFSRWQHLGIASGHGVPNELLTGDLANISDRALRIILNEFRRHCGQRQWHVVIPMLCQPVRDEWARAMLLSGGIKPGEFQEAIRVTWAPEAFADVHPTQDVQARILKINAGLRSRSQTIEEFGEDPEEVDRLRLEDARRAAGLPER